MDYYIYNGELYHHGVKGMKWGQHIFGKKKTGSKLRRKADRDDQEQEVKAKPKAKTHREMSDEELRKATDRYNLESNYLNARSRVEPLPPKKGDSFTKRFMDEAVKPALINAGKQQMEKYLNNKLSKMLGNKETDSLEKLRKESELLGLKSKISTSKKIIESNKDWFANREESEAKAAKDKADAEARKTAAQKQVDDYNNRPDSTYRMSGRNVEDNKVSTGRGSSNRLLLNEPVERFDATWRDVVGEGTSRFKGWNEPPAKDLVYNGERYVEHLLQLEDKGRPLQLEDKHGKG